jgi:hypothetical protein
MHMDDVLDNTGTSRPGARPTSDLSLEDIPVSLTSPSIPNTSTSKPSVVSTTPNSSFSTITKAKPSPQTAAQTLSSAVSTLVSASPLLSSVTGSSASQTSSPKSTTSPNATQPLKDYVTVKTDADVTWCRPWPNTVITTPSALHIYKLTELNLTCWVPTDKPVGANGTAQPDAHDTWVKTGTQGCYINENDLKASQLDFEFILRPCDAPGPYPLQPNPALTGTGGLAGVPLPTGKPSGGTVGGGSGGVTALTGAGGNGSLSTGSRTTFSASSAVSTPTLGDASTISQHTSLSSPSEATKQSSHLPTITVSLQTTPKLSSVSSPASGSTPPLAVTVVPSVGPTSTKAKSAAGSNTAVGTTLPVAHDTQASSIKSTAGASATAA